MEAKDKLKLIKNLRLGLMVINMMLDSYEKKILSDSGIKKETDKTLSFVNNIMENLDLESMFKSPPKKGEKEV